MLVEALLDSSHRKDVFPIKPFREHSKEKMSPAVLLPLVMKFKLMVTVDDKVACNFMIIYTT